MRSRSKPGGSSSSRRSHPPRHRGPLPGPDPRAGTHNEKKAIALAIAKTIAPRRNASAINAAVIARRRAAPILSRCSEANSGAATAAHFLISAPEPRHSDGAWSLAHSRPATGRRWRVRESRAPRVRRERISPRSRWRSLTWRRRRRVVTSRWNSQTAWQTRRETSGPCGRRRSPAAIRRRSPAAARLHGSSALPTRPARPALRKKMRRVTQTRSRCPTSGSDESRREYRRPR